jgi:galactoside O-acetyltransferase
MDMYKTLVYPMAKLVYPENIVFGRNVIIDDFVFIVSKQATYLGDYTHIASFTSITGGGAFMLGACSTLSSGVRILTGTEELAEPSLLGAAIPAPYRTPIRSFVKIGKHCMIGANAVVLPGVNIPDGVVIGAASLVLEDAKLDPWGIYAGSPVKFIRKRPRDAILALADKFLEAVNE